jgi:hypothetical protein
MFFGEIFRRGEYRGFIPPTQFFYSGSVDSGGDKDRFHSIGNQILDALVILLDVEDGGFIEMIIYRQPLKDSGRRTMIMRDNDQVDLQQILNTTRTRHPPLRPKQSTR